MEGSQKIHLWVAVNIRSMSTGIWCRIFVDRSKHFREICFHPSWRWTQHVTSQYHNLSIKLHGGRHHKTVILKDPFTIFGSSGMSWIAKTIQSYFTCKCNDVPYHSQLIMFISTHLINILLQNSVTISPKLQVTWNSKQMLLYTTTIQEIWIYNQDLLQVVYCSRMIALSLQYRCQQEMCCWLSTVHKTRKLLQNKHTVCTCQWKRIEL